MQVHIVLGAVSVMSTSLRYTTISSLLRRELRRKTKAARALTPA